MGKVMEISPPLHRVLVGTDFSDAADQALDIGIAYARVLAAVLDIVHVISAPVMVLPPPLELVAFPTLFPDLPRRLQESLDERAARARKAGLTCTTSLLEGPPHIEIVRHARDTNADLIVVGTHGRTGIAHAVLGSVAERVVHRSACPVLVVPALRSAPSRA